VQKCRWATPALPITIESCLHRVARLPQR